MIFKEAGSRGELPPIVKSLIARLESAESDLTESKKIVFWLKRSR